MPKNMDNLDTPFDEKKIAREDQRRIEKAAPDMLTALSKCVDALTNCHDGSEERNDPIMHDIGRAIRGARAAIAKARGL